MPLRRLLVLTLLSAGPALAAGAPPTKSSELSRLDPTMGVNPAAADNLDWHDVTSWGVEGRAFGDRQRWFDRLPAAA